MKIFASLAHKADRQSAVRHIKNSEGRGDRWLLLTTVVLSIIGIIMVYDSSVAIAFRDFSNPYHFVRDQVKWLLLGFTGFTILSRIPYGIWKRFAVPGIVVTLILLIAVFIPGLGVRALGAHRWIDFGFFVLQPAEFAKLAMVLYLSAWFATKEHGRLLAFLLLLGMVSGLVIIEPDLGTAITIIVTSMALYFLSGAPVGHFIGLIPVLIVGIAGLAVVQPYRLRRVTTFLNPESDPLGASYQIRQALIALGSGGFFGVGLGKSRQKYEYLPEANTDSIFAILGEEVGFFGAVIVIALFVFLVWRCFKIAKRVNDPFGKLFTLGVGSWIGAQALVNTGSMVALLPLTGVPLPLISYGGSGLIVTLAALGIVYNISKSGNKL
ncbi:MAG: putative lipid II flippase FtsW [Patescibacteria group bacterium]